MAIFKISFDRTIGIEGGYSNIASDRGGRTYKGIAERMWPDWPGWVIVNKHEPLKRYQVIASEALDRMVEDFYRVNFWDMLRLGAIRSQDVADELFDTAVNMGVETAGRFLQQGLNLLNRDQRDYKNLEVDGDIGNNTLGIANGFANTPALLKTLNGLQFCRYRDICLKDPGQEANFAGWLKRVTI